MKNFIKNNKSLFVKTCITLGLILVFILLCILKSSPDVCETYSRGFGRVIFTIFAAISKYFPISMTELFAVCSIISVIVWIVSFIKNLRKKNVLKGIEKVVNIVMLGCAILTTYTATMELQYNRKSLPIPLYQENVDKSQFMEILNYFVDDYNDCTSKLKFKENGDVISPYSITDINIKLAKEFERLNEERFGGYFGKFTTNVKPMMSSELYSQLQITGLTFGCFGEANVNTAAPTSAIPFVMAHELAHTKGVLREDDANLVALFLMLTSEDYFFRFSGYFYSFYRVIPLAFYTGNESDYATIYYKMDQNIFKNDEYNSKYWDEHDLLGKIGDWFNDLYLKSSGTEGTSSYNDTEPEIDEEKEIVISFSTYQKMYFQVYFNEK